MHLPLYEDMRLDRWSNHPMALEKYFNLRILRTFVLVRNNVGCTCSKGTFNGKVFPGNRRSGTMNDGRWTMDDEVPHEMVTF